MGWVRKNTGIDLTGWIGDVGNIVGDILGGVGDLISSGLKSISNTIEGILKDPLPALLQIGGSMVGIPPYVTAAVITASKGGKLEDIAKSAAVSYATSSFLQNTQIGADIRNYTSNAFAGDFTDAMMENFDLTADQAVQIARVSTAALNSSLVGGIGAALTGESVSKGLVSGFASGLIYSSTDSYFDSLNKDPNWGFSPKALDLMKGATTTALNTIVSGKGDPAAALGNYIAYSALKLGSSELYKSVTKAYEDFTGKTELAQKAQDEYVSLKAKFDSEAGKYNTTLATLQSDQSAFQNIYNNEYTPIVNQLNQYKANFDANKATYDSAKATFDNNKWAYENYYQWMANSGYLAHYDDTSGTNVYKRALGVERDAYGNPVLEQRLFTATDSETGYQYQYYGNVLKPDGSVRDANGNPTIKEDIAPTQQELADAAKAAAATANAAAAAAKAASDSYTALNSAETTQDVINRLKAKEAAVSSAATTLEGIRKQIEAPSGDNLAAQLKAAADKYQKEYTSFAASKDAANRASENYNKIIAEVGARDATIDAINSGAIEVVGTTQDGAYQLSNGMTLKDGKFYEKDNWGRDLLVPAFTNAAGISQNGLEFFDGSGNLIKYGSDLGRQLSVTDVRNIFARDFGLNLTDDEARQFAGASYTNFDPAKFQSHALDKISSEFEKIANRKPTEDESKAFLNQDDSVGAAQNAAVNGLDLPDDYLPPGATPAQKVSFGQAYAAARKELGPGKTFEWTDDKGVTRTYNTDTKEEVAYKKEQAEIKDAVNRGTGDFDNRDVSLVKTRLTEAIRMSNITGRFDETTNPADLTEKEMGQFIDNYVKATPEQRGALLRGADAMTYKVINDHLQNYAGVSEKTSGQTYAPVMATGDIKASNYTDYIGTVKTGIRTAGADLVGLGTRAGQVVGEILGYDTPMLDKLQTLMSEDKDKAMNKLVGNERVVAGGLASGISSALSWALGGPVGAMATLGGIAANNAWIEGSEAVIDSKGRTWKNAEEARANGVATYTKLTPEQNGIRTAVMASLEIAGEALGVPGMSKLMKGIPITGDVGQIVNAVKNFGLGLGNEMLSETLTTTAQMAADKYLSVGLGKNATFEDYLNALRDTAVATTAAVGVAGGAGTALQNLRNASRTANPFSEDTRETSVTPTLPSLNDTYKNLGVQQYDIDQIAKGIQNTIKQGGVGIETIKDRTTGMLQNLGATGARAESLANEMVDRVLDQTLTNNLTTAGLNADQIAAVKQPLKDGLINQVGPNVFKTQMDEALSNANATAFGEAVGAAVLGAQTPISPATPVTTTPTTPATTTPTTPTGGTQPGAATGTTAGGVATGTTGTGGATTTTGGAATTGETRTIAPASPEARANAELALKMSVGMAPKDMRYDANKDGRISSADALALLKGAPIGAAEATTGTTTGTTTGAVTGTTTGTATGATTGTTTGTTTGATTGTATGTTTGTTTGTATGTTPGTTPGTIDTTGLSPEIAAAFDTLSSAQKADVAARVQMGENLESAISGVAASVADLAKSTQTAISDIGKQVTELGASTKQAFDSLSAEQKTEVAARVAMGETLQGAIDKVSTETKAAITGLGTQIEALGTATQTAFDGLSAAQKAEVAARVQQGEDLQKAIDNVSTATQEALTGLGTQIETLGTETKTAFNSLNEAQKAEVAARVQQGEDLTTAIGTVAQSVTELAASTKTAIEGVSNAVKDLGTATQTAFETMSEAQKAEVAARVQQGENLQNAINSVSQALTEQGAQTQTALEAINQSIASLGAETQTAFETMSAAQKAEVAARVEMGQNLETAINTVQQNLTQTNTQIQSQLTTLSQQTQAQYDELNANQKAEVAARVQMGEDLDKAIGTVGMQLGTEIAGLKSDIAAEKARQVAEAQKAAQAAKSKELTQRAMALVGGVAGSAAADAAISGPTFKDPFKTSMVQEQKFKGPLEEFLKTVKEGSYTSTGQTMQQQQPQQQQPQPVQQPTSPDQNYFAYGTASEIDAILNPMKGMEGFTPYTLQSKEGGLASVLMAQGGGTRHGRYAGGGLNVVQHSGKHRVDFRQGDAVTGPGDGQSDDIPAMLADGEFVFPADVVAALGNGSTKAGSDKLYDMMHSIRAYHRSAKPEDLPPPARKSPLDYLKDSKPKARR
jgi:hypothetical protein